MLTCVSLYRLYLVIRSVRGQPQPSRATKTRVSITIITSFSSISNITISSITVMWGFNQNAGNPTSPPLCCNLWSRLCRLVRNCLFCDFPVKREETWPIIEIQILSQIFSCFLMQRKVEGVITKKREKVLLQSGPQSGPSQCCSNACAWAIATSMTTSTRCTSPLSKKQKL